jgi:hypothetical protein
MDLFWSLLLALLAAPVVGGAALFATYGILTLRGVSEREGRRGLLAFALGFLPGALLGFALALRLVWWLRRGEPSSLARFLAALGLALLLALLAGLGGWIFGIARAEARGVSNYAGERAAWGFLRWALPCSVLGALGGFALGNALFG